LIDYLALIAASQPKASTSSDASHQGESEQSITATYRLQCFIDW